MEKEKCQNCKGRGYVVVGTNTVEYARLAMGMGKSIPIL
jgi:hypothetical protein